MSPQEEDIETPKKIIKIVIRWGTRRRNQKVHLNRTEKAGGKLTGWILINDGKISIRSGKKSSSSEKVRGIIEKIIITSSLIGSDDATMSPITLVYVFSQKQILSI